MWKRYPPMRNALHAHVYHCLSLLSRGVQYFCSCHIRNNYLCNLSWQKLKGAAQRIPTVSVPGSKVHGASIGPTWILSAPDGPHVGPMNLAIRGLSLRLVHQLWCESSMAGCCSAEANHIYLWQFQKRVITHQLISSILWWINCTPVYLTCF